METQSIINIKDYRDKIKEKLATTNTSQFSNQLYGSEKEYTGKGIYSALDDILIDISYLVKAHNIFIQLSTLSERNQIINDLSYTLSYLESPPNLVTYIDNLKTNLRKYNVRNSTERWELFQEVNQQLLEQSIEFKNVLIFINKIKEEAENSNTSVTEQLEAISKKFEELEEKIVEVEEVKTEIVENSENLKEINDFLEKINATAVNNIELIKESLTEIKSNEKIINSFAQKVQERDTRLGEVQQLTEENKQKLIDYEQERSNILIEARQLIDSAKTALNYKTAEGISASFQEQHTNAKDWHLKGWWIIGALLFIGIAISLGVWILIGQTDKIHIIIGRIALIPLPIVGAIFCANQYVKQKNIIEDYAYKMVLAKSIVGFSEQLKKDPSEDRGEYIHYIKVALEEIHKDPLRKRVIKIDSNNSQIENLGVKDVLEVAERIVKLGKE